MTRIHGLASRPEYTGDTDWSRSFVCFCGRIFYSEKEFRDHLSTVAAQT